MYDHITIITNITVFSHPERVFPPALIQTRAYSLARNVSLDISSPDQAPPLDEEASQAKKQESPTSQSSCSHAQDGTELFADLAVLAQNLVSVVVARLVCSVALLMERQAVVEDV